MAELRRTFRSAKMNQDADERLVPQDQYISATNVEIATSEGSNLGTVQNLFGNSKLATMDSPSGYYGVPDTATCVGSIAALDKDKVYYFVSGGDKASVSQTIPDISRDYIMEYDSVLETHKYVFVDIYRVATKVTDNASSADHVFVESIATDTPPGLLNAINTTGIRVGMNLVINSSTLGQSTYSVTNIELYSVTTGNLEVNKWKVTLDGTLPASAFSEGDAIIFSAPRVLNFNRTDFVTAINILDDFIYWTDGKTEPKKVNIKRSIAGTGGLAYLKGAGTGYGTGSPTDDIFDGDTNYFHTRLVIPRTKATAEDLFVVTKDDGNEATYVQEKHVTVMKPSPTQPVELKMYTSAAPRFPDDSEVENPTQGFVENLDLYLSGYAEIGDNLVLNFTSPVDVRLNDIIRLNIADFDSGFVDTESYGLRVKVVQDDAYPISNDPNSLQSSYAVVILSIRAGISTDQTYFRAALEQGDSLFEFKFPRFSYRYKYTDGEYSTFAPFSEIAFMPDSYEFSAKQGYNLGMSNQLRSLVISGYHAGEDRMTEDVVEIDILYKETNNPTVYKVKTIKESDGAPAWPNPNGLDGLHSQRGSIVLTTDLVYEVLPSNQLLRSWDNVPRHAVAQEISANRLIYGNYTQNYDVIENPELLLSYVSNDLNAALPSVKTMRDYTVGVVFSDTYGRETPVLTSDNASIKLPKSVSYLSNRLSVKLSDATNIPDWASHYSFYVKEPTVEYYNLILDRWYPSQDANIWLSFPSSERNKVKEEDFLILKKKLGANTAIGGSSKYKILAIKNDAPTYVKTVRRSIGRVYDDNNYMGNSEEGYPLDDRNFFTMQSTAVETVLGEDFSTTKLSVRFRGNGQNSQYYDIAKVTNPPNDNKHYFYLDGKFGPDVDFLTAYTGNAGNAISTAMVDFYDVEIGNRPEFDGRFFVKINRDSELDRHLVPFGDDVYVSKSFPVAYINNNGYRNHSRGQLIPNDPKSLNCNVADSDIGVFDGFKNNNNTPDAYWNDGDGGVQANTNHQHPTEFSYHNHNPNNGSDSENTNNSRYFWGGGLNATSAGSPSNGTTIVNMAQRIAKDPIGALNSQNGGSNVNSFWKDFATKRQFFFDGATAYSLTGWVQHAGAGCNSFFEDILDVDFGDEMTPGAGNLAEGQVLNYQYGAIFNENAPYFYQDGAVESTAGTLLQAYGYYYNPNLYGAGIGNTVTPNHPSSIYQVDNLPSPEPASGPQAYFTPTDIPGYAAANMKINHGLPSRAIRDGVYNSFLTGEVLCSFMDISWTGMGLGSFGEENYNPDGTTAAQTLAQATGEVVEGEGLIFNKAWDFITTLQKKGTRFRFQNDPDEIIYTVEDYSNTSEGFLNDVHWKPSSHNVLGAFGIVNFGDDVAGNTQNLFYSKLKAHNRRQRWSLVVVPRIGSGPSGYNPIQGTKDPDNGGPVYSDARCTRAIHHDGTNHDAIEILEMYNEDGSGFTPSGAVFETQPRESVELDLYYQASPLIPTVLTKKTNEEFIPLGSTIDLHQNADFFSVYSGTSNPPKTTFTVTGWVDKNTLTIKANTEVTLANTGIINNFYPVVSNDYTEDVAGIVAVSDGTALTFNTSNGNSVTARLKGDIQGLAIGTYETDVVAVTAGFAPVSGYSTLTIYGDETTEDNVNKLHTQTHKLGWNNCWSFGNGVESDRIRDDFNAAQIDNGVKVSSTVSSKVKEEKRKHGLIWSGIYNSVAGVNDTNQFIIAEAITKDINPIYGSIQKLYNRDTRLIMFCEDKILKAVTNKDALYNADGSSQLVSSNAVVGDVTAYQGDFGISKNPESFAATPYNMYFTDAMRGQVLALSTEGVRSISNIGMISYFSELFNFSGGIVARGSYDERKSEYNITVEKRQIPSQYNPESSTISYSERSKGWTSFKTFYPQDGISINNKYFTFYQGQIWQHHVNDVRNSFYGADSSPSILKAVFNQLPESVKSFNTINYEGSQGKTSVFTDVDSVQMLNGVYSTNDGVTVTNDVTGANSDGSATLSHEYFNLNAKSGWYANSITTDQQSCGNIEFKNKEGKWYGFPTGEALVSSGDLANLDTQEFSVQGLGTASISHSQGSAGGKVTIKVKNNTSTTYNPDGTGIWDVQSDE